MKSALGLVEACNLIQNKQLTAEEFLEQCVERANQIEPILKAFTIRATLSTLQQRSGVGPLMGIPVAVKDLIATKDFVTTNGSPIYKDFTPRDDAEIVNQHLNDVLRLFHLRHLIGSGHSYEKLQ